jgi:TRAP transporter TAXI family solute receptor
MNVKSMVLTGLLFAASAVHANSIVGVGTMSQGTMSYTTGSVIAKVMKEKMSLEARVQPNSGETVLVPLINGGELDFGIANILEAQEAVSGEGTFKGRPQANLRIAAALFPLRTTYFVRADSPIKTIADLKGKRVTVGFSAMGSVDKIAKALLASGGVQDGDYRPVLVPNVVAAADKPELIKQVLTGIAENKSDLVAAFPLFRGLDTKLMVKPELQVPYHPASLDWARSQR